MLPGVQVNDCSPMTKMVFVIWRCGAVIVSGVRAGLLNGPLDKQVVSDRTMSTASVPVHVVPSMRPTISPSAVTPATLIHRPCSCDPSCDRSARIAAEPSLLVNVPVHVPARDGTSGGAVGDAGEPQAVTSRTSAPMPLHIDLSLAQNRAAA